MAGGAQEAWKEMRWKSVRSVLGMAEDQDGNLLGKDRRGLERE